MKSLEVGILHIYVHRMCVHDVLENIMLVLVSSQPSVHLSVQAEQSSVQPSVQSLYIQCTVQCASEQTSEYLDTLEHMWTHLVYSPRAHPSVYCSAQSKVLSSVNLMYISVYSPVSSVCQVKSSICPLSLCLSSPCSQNPMNGSYSHSYNKWQRTNNRFKEGRIKGTKLK